MMLPILDQKLAAFLAEEELEQIEWRKKEMARLRKNYLFTATVASFFTILIIPLMIPGNLTGKFLLSITSSIGILLYLTVSLLIKIQRHTSYIDTLVEKAIDIEEREGAKKKAQAKARADKASAKKNAERAAKAAAKVVEKNKIDESQRKSNKVKTGFYETDKERRVREEQEKIKALEDRRKAAKIEAFQRKNFQSDHRPPNNSQKEKAWTGACLDCKRSSLQSKLSFWWRIYPKLEVVLLCDECAEKDGLVEERETVDERRSRRIPEDVKDAVWRRDQGICVECGSNEDLEFDHIIPHSRGGSNNKRNIQLLCESCNRKKSDNIG